VILHDESALAVLDTGRNRVLAYLPVPLGPRGPALTPDGRKLYIGSPRDVVVQPHPVVSATTGGPV
jgi:DNA-binding beta-propeller fold protein YncE